jgi:hypothetical protein
MRLSTPPRLSASVHTSVRDTSSTASSSVSRRNDTIPPKSRICRAAIPCPGWSGSPGQSTFVTRGCAERNSATARAFAQWRSIRTASVFRPRSTSQESNGPAIAPSDFCRKRRRSAIVGSFVPAKPPTTSEWPPRYFVVEWRTMSAPRSSGVCRNGVANVLSTTSNAPAAFAAAATAAMSTRLRSGFVGVSIQTSRASATCAWAAALSSSGVTYVKR